MAGEKRLYLLRHAKSSWTDPGLPDHDRPLAPRGRRAAALIGEYLRREQISVGLVLCSSAQRAVQTLELLGVGAPAEIGRELYGASAEELLDRLGELPDELDSVLLVGHNPAIQDLAAGLSGAAAGLADSKYPTGALAELTFVGSWSELRPQRADLTAFIRPRDLG